MEGESWADTPVDEVTYGNPFDIPGFPGDVVQLPPEVYPATSPAPVYTPSIWTPDPMNLPSTPAAGPTVTGGGYASGVVTEAGLDILRIAAPAVTALLATGGIQKAIDFLKNALGSNWLKVVAVGTGLGIIGVGVYQLLNAGKKKKRKKRYSIGTNPRLGTLIKVGRRVDKITGRFFQRARHAGLIKIPHRTQYRKYRRK